jgi:hypothetical protein
MTLVIIAVYKSVIIVPQFADGDALRLASESSCDAPATHWQLANSEAAVTVKHWHWHGTVEFLDFIILRNAKTLIV